MKRALSGNSNVRMEPPQPARLIAFSAISERTVAHKSRPLLTGAAEISNIEGQSISGHLAAMSPSRFHERVSTQSRRISLAFGRKL
jgi:hypothetical protein